MARAAGAAETATVHALGWLVVGNTVGVLLALLLLLPALNAPLAPLTYGRWMPVHWNAQLYGWSALPLVGLLLRAYRRAGRADRWARLAVSAWSATLAVGAVSWLAGRTTGKPFLEWSGPVRWLLVGNLALLAAVLVAGLVAQRRSAPGWSAGLLGKAVLLLALLPVPAAMAHATSPATYPPVNPASGGPTGASLLGSTLGIVALFVVAPFLLGLSGQRRRTAATAGLLALHGALFLLLLAVDGGDRSHHEALQVAAVASLAVWPPALAWYLRAFCWPAGTRRWLGALAGWGGFLVVSAVVTFLPGVLERWKFTNALVAHAHLAMAGLVTSFVVLVLMGLTREGALAATFRPARPFVLWHGGCLVYVLAMLALGSLEAADPGVVIRGAAAGAVLYAVRLAAGLAMLAASVEWLAAALGGLARSEATA
jgi:cytochrome c oxidase cbb3-type subunit 1